MESFLQNISASVPASKCSQRVSRIGMLYVEIGGRDVPEAEAAEKVLPSSEKKILVGPNRLLKPAPTTLNKWAEVRQKVRALG